MEQFNSIQFAMRQVFKVLAMGDGMIVENSTNVRDCQGLRKTILSVLKVKTGVRVSVEMLKRAGRQ